jgi:hypothetical protein
VNAIDSMTLAARLHDRVLAPVVLGGAVRPIHAIGVRAALAFDGPPPDSPLAALVRAARVRAARRVVPVDSVSAPGPAEWALAAALNDIFQSVSPAFATPLRRGIARRILGAAEAILDRTAAAKTAGEALARHSWFGRVFELRRTDTTVSSWVGAQTFAGSEPPARLRAWPEVRRVTVTKIRGTLFDLAPLAVPRDRVVRAMVSFLSRSPLTDLATCARSEPAFAWSPSTIGLLAEPVGRRLALRALALLPADAADASLGRATRALDRRDGPAMAHVLRLLGERALGSVSSPDAPSGGPSPASDTVFARTLGAFAARAQLEDEGNDDRGDFRPGERSRWLTGLSAVVAHGPEVEDFVRAYGLR